jgi:hypothetical protein
MVQAELKRRSVEDIKVIEDLLLQLINHACRLDRVEARAREELFQVHLSLRTPAHASRPVPHYQRISLCRATCHVCNSSVLLPPCSVKVSPCLADVGNAVVRFLPVLRLTDAALLTDRSAPTRRPLCRRL